MGFWSAVPWWAKWDLRADLWPLTGSTHGAGKPTVPGLCLCMACLSSQAREALAPGTHLPHSGVAVSALVGDCCPCLLQTLEVKPPHRTFGTLLVPWTLGFTLWVWSVCVQLMRLVSQCPTGGCSHHACCSAEPCLVLAFFWVCPRRICL